MEHDYITKRTVVREPKNLIEYYFPVSKMKDVTCGSWDNDFENSQQIKRNIHFETELGDIISINFISGDVEGLHKHYDKKRAKDKK